MFHHVVLFRLKPGVTLERVRGAREALAGLVERLPGVEALAVTHNVSERNGGFTLALFSVFESRAAYEIFRRHPEVLNVWEQQLAPVVDEHLVAQGDDSA